MRFRLHVAALLLAATTACQLFGIGERKSPLQETLGGTKMTAAALRERVRALALPFSGQLETAADELAAIATTNEEHRQLLQFKINAIPQMQAALFRTDPVAALVDAWALTLQLQTALDRIDPDDAFPPGVRATFEDMEGQLRSLWQQMTGREDVSGAREMVTRWADAHPLESLAVRPTTQDLLADLTTRARVSPMQAAGELLETTQDALDRLDVQTAFLPKQARWQAELLMRQLLADPQLVGGGIDTEGLLANMNAALVTAASAPRWTEAELGIAMRTLREERLALQAFVAEERAAAFAQADAAGERLIDRAFLRTDALVDRILLRLLVFTLLLLAGGVLLALLFFRRRDRRGRLVARRRPARI